MTEKVILLEGIDPVEFYGLADANIEKIGGKFPKLKIVARGSAIKVMGEESEIVRFDKKLAELLAYYERYGHISPQVIDQIYDGGLSAVQDDPEDQHVIVYGNNGLVVRARTVNQERLLNLYDRNDLIFAIGPAGSGKTYTAIALAVRALKNREVKRIILTRPAVEAGEKLGFLPGDMKEKLDPYLQPLYDALNDMIPAAKLGKYVEDGTVQIAPLAYMRGRTLDNAFVILDEAQNVPDPHGAQRPVYRYRRHHADRPAAAQRFGSDARCGDAERDRRYRDRRIRQPRHHPSPAGKAHRGSLRTTCRQLRERMTRNI